MGSKTDNRSLADTLTLSNGVGLPQLGFGVYKSLGDSCFQSCKAALSSGYRNIDSGQYYENEEEVGRAVKASGLNRADVFLSTKILVPAGSVDDSYAQCLESVKKLDGEGGYVDLFMIHSPSRGTEKVKEMWQALERLYEEGKVKSIGVSNFGIKHIEAMKSYAKVWPPHVNQIELHPWLQQRETTEYCQKQNIALEAYCPIVRNQKADNETLLSLAKKYEATPNQVLIRYCIQKGWAPLPKSENADRIKANMDVYGFSLDEESMKTLDDLDQGPAGAIVQAVENY